MTQDLFAISIHRGLHGLYFLGYGINTVKWTFKICN